MMPDIPPILYRWILSSGPASDDERFAINNFIVEAINEYDDDQLPVDAEWLDKKTRNRRVDRPDDGFFLWQISKRIRVFLEDGQWGVQVDGVDFKFNPTRGDIRKLLEILEDKK